MSYNGGKKQRNISGNKPKKSTFIYHQEQEEISGELEYNQLVMSINGFYDNLIKSIEKERKQIIHELERIFLFKSSAGKDRIHNKVSQYFHNPLPEYFFKKVHSTIANSNSHAYLLNNIFLGDESIGRKSIIYGIPFDFLRVKKFNSEFFYLTSDPSNVLYVSVCSDLSTATPLGDRQSCKVNSQDNSKSKKTKNRRHGRRIQERRNVETDWAAEPDESQIGLVSWDNPASDWIEPDSWGTPVDQSLTFEWNTDTTDNRWGGETEYISPDEVGSALDFVITETSDTFVTYPTSGRIGWLRLNNRNINKIKYFSISSISQPTGICTLQSAVSTLVVIVDGKWSKVCAFELNNLLSYTTSSCYSGYNELESEFTVQFGKAESPLLIYTSNVKHQFIILTHSNAIYTVNDTGSVISKLPYSELISPYDMKIMGNGDILIVDLESLVILDHKGCCISKYFHNLFSQGGCINYTECIEFITRVREIGSLGLESIEVAILD